VGERAMLMSNLFDEMWDEADKLIVSDSPEEETPKSGFDGLWDESAKLLDQEEPKIDKDGYEDRSFWSKKMLKRAGQASLQYPKGVALGFAAMAENDPVHQVSAADLSNLDPVEMQKFNAAKKEGFVKDTQREIQQMQRDKNALYAKEAREWAKMFPEIEAGSSGKWEDAVVGMSQYLPAMLLQAIPGMQIPAFMTMVAHETGFKYEDYVKAGLSREDAYQNAMAHGITSALIEQTGGAIQIGRLKALFKGAGVAANLSKKFIGALETLAIGPLSEGLEEVGQAYMEVFWDVNANMPGASQKEIIQATQEIWASDEFKSQRNVSFDVGARGGLIMAGMGTASSMSFNTAKWLSERGKIKKLSPEKQAEIEAIRGNDLYTQEQQEQLVQEIINPESTKNFKEEQDKEVAEEEKPVAEGTIEETDLKTGETKTVPASPDDRLSTLDENNQISEKDAQEIIDEVAEHTKPVETTKPTEATGSKPTFTTNAEAVSSGVTDDQIDEVNRVRIAQAERQKEMAESTAEAKKSFKDKQAEKVEMARRAAVEKQQTDAKRQEEILARENQNFFNDLKTEQGTMERASSWMRDNKDIKDASELVKGVRAVHEGLAIGSQSEEGLKSRLYRMQEAAKETNSPKVHALVDSLTKLTAARIENLRMDETLGEVKTNFGKRLADERAKTAVKARTTQLDEAAPAKAEAELKAREQRKQERARDIRAARSEKAAQNLEQAKTKTAPGKTGAPKVATMKETEGGQKDTQRHFPFPKEDYGTFRDIDERNYRQVESTKDILLNRAANKPNWTPTKKLQEKAKIIQWAKDTHRRAKTTTVTKAGLRFQKTDEKPSSTGVTIASVLQDVFDKARERLKGITQIQVKENYQSIRESDPEAYAQILGEGGENSGIRAMYNPDSKQLYIFAHRLPAGNEVKAAFESAWHELTHFSLDSLFSESELREVLRFVNKHYTGLVDKKMRQYRYEETNRQAATEEVVVDMFLSGKDKNFVTMVMDMFRTLMHNLGFGDIATDQRIRQLARGIRKRMHSQHVDPVWAKNFARDVQISAYKSTVFDAGKAGAMFQIDALKWKAPHEKEIFGTVNNRLGKELELFELFFGQSKKAQMWPGKQVKGKRIPTRTIGAYDLGVEMFRVKESGQLKELIDPKVPLKDIAAKLGYTGTKLKKFMKEAEEFRSGPMMLEIDEKGKPILGQNGKAGMSADFLLATCQPTKPCKECYAAASMIRMSAVRKAMRNTAHIMLDPEGWAKRSAMEVNKVAKTKLPFVRLLGSGDMTFSEQVDAFNMLAENIDRPIQIFSRHHDNLGKLKGTADSPFIKMGSLDAQLYKHYGHKFLEENMEKRGIANAWLLTDESEITAIKKLNDKSAIALVLAADVDLHKKLPKLIRQTGCPCDADERSYFASCIQCALSNQGCFMAFAAKGYDSKGKIWNIMDPKAPEGLQPFTQFLKGVKPTKGVSPKARAYANAAAGIIGKSISLINGNIKKFEKWQDYKKQIEKGTWDTKKDKPAKAESITLKDIRFPEDKIVVKDIKAAEAYRENLKKMKQEALNGYFLLPGGEIQPPVKYDNWMIPTAKFQKTGPTVNRDEFIKGSQFPLAYHGTTHTDINVFEPDHGNKDGFMGAGPYFTTSHLDANANYGNINAPDITGRINDAAEQMWEVDEYTQEEMLKDFFAKYPEDLYRYIAQEAPVSKLREDQIDDFMEINDLSYEDLWETFDNDAVMHAARQVVAGESDGLIMPVNLRVRKPFFWFAGDEDTVIEAELPDIAIMEKEGEDVYFEELDRLINEHPFLGAIDEVYSEYIDDGSVDPEAVKELRATVALEISEGGITGTRFSELVDELIGTMYDYESPTGTFISSGHILQQVLRATGQYDALVMNAGRTFPHMHGVDMNTYHIMPFKPTQIKSSIGNNGNFSLSNPDIRFQKVSSQDELAKLDMTKVGNQVSPSKGSLPKHVMNTKTLEWLKGNKDAPIVDHPEIDSMFKWHKDGVIDTTIWNFADIDQELTSAKTSINDKKKPGVFTWKKDWQPGTTNFDLGGGRFDIHSVYLKGKGVTNRVYDPFNRSNEHNRKVLTDTIKEGGADTVTSANVLNVIKERENRVHLVKQAFAILKPGGTATFQVHYIKGKEAGPTQQGTSWQNHKPAEWYLPEIEEIFGKENVIKTTQQYIVVHKPEQPARYRYQKVYPDVLGTSKGVVFIGADGMGADIDGNPSPDESFRYPDYHKAWTASKSLITNIENHADKGFTHIAVVTYKHVRNSMKNHPHYREACRRAMLDEVGKDEMAAAMARAEKKVAEMKAAGKFTNDSLEHVAAMDVLPTGATLKIARELIVDDWKYVAGKVVGIGVYGGRGELSENEMDTYPGKFKFDEWYPLETPIGFSELIDSTKGLSQFHGGKGGLWAVVNQRGFIMNKKDHPITKALMKAAHGDQKEIKKITKKMPELTPEVAKGVRWQKVTEDQQNTLDHIGFSGGKSSDKVRGVADGIMDKFVTQTADGSHALRVLEDQEGIEKAEHSGWKAMQMMSNFPSIFSAVLNEGKPEFRNEWIYVQPDKNGGLVDVINRLGDQADDFMLWQLAKSAQEMRKKGRTNLFGRSKQTGEMLDDEQQISNLLALTEYKVNDAWLKAESELKEFNDSILDFAVKSHLISQKDVDSWKRENYIPFYRNIDKWSTGDIESLFPNSEEFKIHKLKGGNSNLGDPLANLISGYSYLMNASLKNLVRLKSLKVMQDAGLMTHAKKAGTGTIIIRVNGKPQLKRVLDENLYNAITSMDARTGGAFSGWVGSIFTAPKKLLTFGVTVAPAFRLANFFRDAIHTSFMRKGSVPIIDSLYQSAKGFGQAFVETEEFKGFVSTGGAFSGAYHERDTRPNTEKEVKKMKKRIRKGKRSNLNPIKLWELWQKIGEASENAARFGLYKKLRAEGKSEFEAGFEAKDLLDFHRSGRSGILQAAIQLIPFLNARIQGLSKLGRAAKDKKTRGWFILNAMVLGAASLALHGFNDDDERYQELQDYERLSYWHFFDVPFFGHVRLPVAFEVGTFFGAMPSAIAEYFQGTRSGKELGKFAMKAVTDIFAFDPKPQFYKPISDQINNRDSYTGMDIVPAYKEKLEPHRQVKPGTSKTAMYVGRMLQDAGAPDAFASPVRIDKFFRDYLSYIAVMATAGTDWILEHSGEYPEDPATRMDERYLSGISRFFRGDDPPKHTRSEQKFYEQLIELDKINNTYRSYKNRVERKLRRPYYKSHKAEIRGSKRLQRTVRKIRKINEKINLILISKGKYTPEEKTKKINDLYEKRAKIFREAVQKIEKKRREE
jgi:hypothetical protein